MRLLIEFSGTQLANKFERRDTTVSRHEDAFVHEAHEPIAGFDHVERFAIRNSGTDVIVTFTDDATRENHIYLHDATVVEGKHMN